MHFNVHPLFKKNLKNQCPIKLFDPVISIPTGLFGFVCAYFH